MKASQIAPEIDKAIETANKLGHVKAIFGEPIKLETTSIVPVGVVITSFGAGGGGLPLLSGMGGGGDLRVLPIGFLSEQAGAVKFTAIDLPPELLHAHAAKKPRPQPPAGAPKGVLERVRAAFAPRTGPKPTPPVAG
ncbi:MAG TPA: hypothetical protein VHE35_17170 [Kofleriaceae bacterium]|nr:hypothetical protein [Kofleriaceae bacterium]